jgi:DNA-binding NarL/FixJ family response regulator
MIRVLVVDEARLMGEAIANVLDDQADIQVIGCATALSRAISGARQCDVVLLNANLGDDGGYRLIRTLTSWGDPANPDSRPRVLVFGLSEARATIMRWVEAGAQGYLSDDASVDELVKNVRSTYRGEAHVSPQVAGALMRRLAEFASRFEYIEPGPGDLAELTPREMEVLKLLGYNFSNQEIADHLVVEVGTVKNHVHNILSKLEVNNRHEAARQLAGTRNQAQVESLAVDLEAHPLPVTA